MQYRMHMLPKHLLLLLETLIEGEIFTKDNLSPQKQLDEMVKQYENFVEAEERKLVAFALEHELRLELGDYGTGRILLLKDDKYGYGKRGEWLYSSENC